MQNLRRSWFTDDLNNIIYRWWCRIHRYSQRTCRNGLQWRAEDRCKILTPDRTRQLTGNCRVDSLEIQNSPFDTCCTGGQWPQACTNTVHRKDRIQSWAILGNRTGTVTRRCWTRSSKWKPLGGRTRGKCCPLGSCCGRTERWIRPSNLHYSLVI